jgi:hypothetical protein
MSLLQDICANSYRNFHAKGFDYLCVLRTPSLTRKVYFFDGDLAQQPELVMPHDHRYAFSTTVIDGSVVNKTFERDASFHCEGAEAYDCFDYSTPLNGGDGFTWREEVLLRPVGPRWEPRRRHDTWLSASKDIHTLQVLEEGTIIILDQYADVVPEGQPTSAFRPVGSRTPPSLDGLYDRMDEDHAIALLERLRRAARLTLTIG